VSDPRTGALGRSRRAKGQYLSKDRVDFGCLSRTSVKSASGGNCHLENELAPEVAHHQSVQNRATFAFDSGRLQPSLTRAYADA
jgi:hypothetical protein